MADQRPGVVSSESVSLNEGIRTHSEAELLERERVERHAFKTDAEHVPVVPHARPVVPSTFLVRLVGLPGPVSLLNADDGTELFSSSGSADVTTTVEVAGGAERKLHLELKLPGEHRGAHALDANCKRFVVSRRVQSPQWVGTWRRGLAQDFPD